MMKILLKSKAPMTMSSSQMSTREPNLRAPLLCWGMSAGLVRMVALFTVGGTTDTLAAGEAAIGPFAEFTCGWSLCLGPSSEVGLAFGSVEGSCCEAEVL